MRKKLYITYNDPKILGGDVFGFTAVNTENMRSKSSKLLPFRRIETVPNHIIPKHEKD